MSVMTPKVLSANIDRIKANAESLRGEVQECLIACAFYIMRDGNTTPANDLLAACTKARIERTAVTAWLENYAPCYVKQDKIEVSRERRREIRVENEKDFIAHEVEMRKVKWYELTKITPARSIFDPVGYIEKVAKKMEKEAVSPEAIELVRKALGIVAQEVANREFDIVVGKVE